MTDKKISVLDKQDPLFPVHEYVFPLDTAEQVWHSINKHVFRLQMLAELERLWNS